MEFRILGPLEVVDGGRVLDLGSRKQRALLTLLLLRRGDIVALDELIEIARLEELRLAAIEERVESDLANGRHAQLVAELEALVSIHPLRERLRAQLMLALYRAGRQAEALEVFNDGRRLLTDELGLE